MSALANHGLTEMQPVFGPDRLGVSEGVSFRQALERLSAEGELKAKLLLVALTHFAARGYDGVQVREVAEEAGVSKPTLYYHFGSKEGLFRQLCLVAMATTERRIQAVVEAALALPLDTPEARREAAFRLTRGYLHLLVENLEFTGFILRSIAVPSPDTHFRDLMPQVERVLSPLGLFIHRAFGVTLDEARKEVVLYTALFGALIEEKLRRPDYLKDDAELDAEVGWAVDRWLRGIEGARR